MSTTVLGYVCLPPAHRDSWQDGDVQLAAIVSFCEQHGLQLGEVFTDQPDAASTPWLDRGAIIFQQPSRGAQESRR